MTKTEYERILREIRYGKPIPRVIPYYGSQWLTAKKLPQPIYDLIIEPFAGSAGYSLNYGRKKRVILSDSYLPIMLAWRFLRYMKCSDIKDLPDIEPGLIVDDQAFLCGGARNLVGFWANHGSVAPRNVPGKFGLTFDYKLRLSQVVGVFSRWSVMNGDYRSLNTSTKATWFIDPPYQKDGGHLYKCNNLDYGELREWVLSLNGQVIVIEGPNADWLEFNESLDGRNQIGNPFTHSLYVLE